MPGRFGTSSPTSASAGSPTIVKASESDERWLETCTRVARAEHVARQRAMTSERSSMEGSILSLAPPKSPRKKRQLACAGKVFAHSYGRGPTTHSSNRGARLQRALARCSATVLTAREVTTARNPIKRSGPLVCRFVGQIKSFTCSLRVWPRREPSQNVMPSNSATDERRACHRERAVRSAQHWRTQRENDRDCKGGGGGGGAHPRSPRPDGP